MVNEIKYTSIKRVLDNLLDHPMLSDLSMEKAIKYTLRFISINGFSKLYMDKQTTLKIEDYRALLPCDLVSIIQVKDLKYGICLRSMTDNFMSDKPQAPELSYKVQNRVIFTSFKEGEIEIAYRAIPVDEDGFPLLIDNETYLAALEAYIKKEIFIVKFDQGKISDRVLQYAKQDYAWLAGQLHSEFVIPSVSEMQTITNMYNTLIPRMSEFYNGFKTLGKREMIVNHNNKR